ncbi:DMT family transporter [Halorarius litoreus]|uniref:DMT family transporter n=1 Tax=Halorarius litoreus TaxID=2962676 RepID=UPI0020CB9AF3|nr:DMT family transporter [Halorarius litoreus]
MSRRRAVALFLFMGIAFGTAFPAIKAGLADAPPLLFAALRFYLSALLLVVYSVVVVREWRPRERGDWLAVVAGGVFSIAGAGFLYLGQQYTTSGVAAIIYSLGPVLTVVFAWLLFPTERASRRAVLGVLVGLLGVALVVRPAPDALLTADFRGKALVLVAVVSVTLGSLLIRRTGTHMPAVTLTAWTLGIGAVLLHAGSLVLGESQAVASTPGFLAILVYLGVVPSGLGFALYFSLLERAGALQANLVVYVVPIVAVLVGWLWLDETLSGLTLLGFLVVFVGFLVLQSRKIAELLRERRASTGT